MKTGNGNLKIVETQKSEFRILNLEYWNNIPIPVVMVWAD